MTPHTEAELRGDAKMLSCDGWEGPCDRKDATRQRQNTAYEKEESNWVTLCPECMKANREHWEAMWKDYYSDKL